MFNDDIDVYNKSFLDELLADNKIDKSEEIKERDKKFKEFFPSENEAEIYKKKYGDDVDVKLAKQMENDKIFQKDVKKVLKREGGYHDGTGDRGGPTNHGISQKAYPKENIEEVTEKRAEYLFYRDYCKGPKICELPDSIRGDVMDNAINQGPYQASLNLQRAVGSKDDGLIGPKTIKQTKKAYKANPAKIKTLFQANVDGTFDAICRNRPGYCKDKIKGWKNRPKNGY